MWRNPKLDRSAMPSYGCYDCYLGEGLIERSTLTGAADLRVRALSKLTALNGEDGEVVDRVGLPVQRLGCADDPTQSIHIKEALQVCVSVNGVPGQKYTTTTRTQPTYFLKIASG